MNMTGDYWYKEKEMNDIWKDAWMLELLLVPVQLQFGAELLRMEEQINSFWLKRVWMRQRFRDMCIRDIVIHRASIVQEVLREQHQTNGVTCKVTGYERYRPRMEKNKIENKWLLKLMNF